MLQGDNAVSSGRRGGGEFEEVQLLNCALWKTVYD